MNPLVNQLLRVARLDSVELDSSQTIDLTAIAMQEIGALAPFALQKNCKIVLERANVSVTLNGNSDAIGDAVCNLLENAIAHSPPGGEISVSVLSPSMIRVADQGPGITIDLREQVFERFWRGRDDRRPGAGLGLATVRDIMTAHGGAVRIEDNPGGGSIFVLKFRE
jgi:signal transduction histidine kinase